MLKRTILKVKQPEYRYESFPKISLVDKLMVLWYSWRLPWKTCITEESEKNYHWIPVDSVNSRGGTRYRYDENSQLWSWVYKG